MDIGQIGDDAWASVRATWREELWLPAGLALAAVAYLLWIGLTGAALSFLAEAIAGSVTVRPWTSLTTFLVAVLALLWVVGPAALAVVLTLDRVTNVNDNLRVGYRLRHPLLLLAPPVALLAVGYGALVGTGTASVPVRFVLLVGGLWLAVRTTAYSYRVFSLSVPVVAWAVLFGTALTLSVATLVGGGLAVGRGTLVADVLAGLATQTGVPALGTLHTASLQVGGVALPLLVVAPVAVPVAGTLAYVGVQLAWSLVVRVWRPTVRRPELRTGQRYPRFARPTTSASTSRDRDQAATGAAGGSAEAAKGSAQSTGSMSAAPAGNTANGAASRESGDAVASADSEAGGGESEQDVEDEMDDVTHTRVFTPPDDAQMAAPEDIAPAEEAESGAASGNHATGRETTVADGSTPGGYCPNCGESVDAGAADCPECGADIDAA